jgi:DNA mismatch repair protein MutH
MRSELFRALRAAFQFRQQTCPPASATMGLSARPALARDEAIRRLNLIVGCDLRALADCYHVVLSKNGHKNKGWAGQALERYLGLKQNSRQEPDFGDWDLKLVSLRRDAAGNLRVKESMAITMLEPSEVASNRFEDSHLYDKLRRLVVVARVFESEEDARSILHAVAKFDLDNPAYFQQVKEDYDLIRRTIREHGAEAVSAELGTLVQARTKGRGHGSTSRAFYARASFVARMLDLQRAASAARIFADEPVFRADDA